MPDQYFRNREGKVFRKTPDGKYIELSQEELKGFDVVPLREDVTKLAAPTDYISPKEQSELLDHYLTSAASTLGSIALGGLASLAFSNPYTGIPLGVAGGAALTNELVENPTAVKSSLVDLVKAIVKPYTSPIESYKEDPFGTVASYLPGVGIPYGFGKSFTKQGTEALMKKLALRAGTPASEQKIFNPLTRSATTMEEPLLYMKSKNIPLTVAQTTDSPLATQLTSEHPDLPNILVKQQQKIEKDVQNLIDVIDGRFKLKSSLAEISEILKDEANFNAQQFMEEASRVKGMLFDTAHKTLPELEVPVDKDIVLKIKGAIPLENTSKISKDIVEADLNPVIKSLTISDETKKLFKSTDDATKRIYSIFNSLNAGVVPQEDIRIVDLFRRQLDSRLAKLKEDDPQRALLAHLRNALDKDIEAGFEKAGLKANYNRYKELTHQGLSILRKTTTGERLVNKNVYSKKLSPTAAVREAFNDTNKFKELTDLVGREPAIAGLIDHIFTQAYDTTNGRFSADTLINLISKHKDKLAFLDTGLKTRLFNLAYGIKAQNRLIKANPALELRGPDAVIKVGGAAATGRKGIIVGQIASATRYVISKTDLSKILIDPEMGWLAAKLVSTPVNSPTYKSRMIKFMQGLGRLGIYARVGDAIFKFDPNGQPIYEGTEEKP